MTDIEWYELEKLLSMGLIMEWEDNNGKIKIIKQLADELISITNKENNSIEYAYMPIFINERIDDQIKIKII